MKLPCSALALLALASIGLAQAPPEFEVASVRVVPPGNNVESFMPTLAVGAGGMVRISNRRLDEIIMLAYNIGGKQLAGPRWLTELTTDPNAVTRFEIQAKVPEGSTKEQIPLMLQKLLAERFQLQVHREQRPAQIYAMTVGKGGSKLAASVPNEKRTSGCARAIGGGNEGAVAADCYNVTAAQLAQQLQSLAPGYFREGPVTDHTGLAGSFDLHLEWMMQQQLDAGMSGPTMFAAVEKLGLKLEKKQEAVETLVVDHCEQKPTEN